MRHASLAAALPCPIARTLDIVGEWWSLIIVRDALLGARRFDDFTVSGISENMLAARLKRLTAEGILKRVRYQSSPDRYEYLLTEKGRELAPVILALRTWGRRWTKGGQLSRVEHEDCGGNVVTALKCEACGQEPHAVQTSKVTARRTGRGA